MWVMHVTTNILIFRGSMKKIYKRTIVIIRRLYKNLEKPIFIKKIKAQFAEFIHCLKMFKISFTSECNARDTRNKTIIKNGHRYGFFYVLHERVMP